MLKFEEQIGKTIKIDIYPLLDELIADNDGCLDGVGVHDLGGVIEAHILGQVQVLVVNMLK